MADNTLKTFINISKSKRQRTEDFEQTRISQRNISSERRCIQLFDETLTEVEINPRTGIDDGLDSPQFNDETITMLSMSTYDQYTSLLILECKAWILCDTVFGIVSDFKLTKTEEVKLTKTFIVVNTDSELCLRCCDHKCTHYQAFEQCSINDYLNLCQPNYVNSYSIFNLSPSTIFLIDNIDLHCFNKKEMKWFCSTCLGKCSRSAILRAYLPDYEFNEPTSEQKEILYPVISNLPIPVSFDDNMISVYEKQQLCKDLNLPLELFPEKEFCDHEYNFHKEGNGNPQSLSTTC